MGELKGKKVLVTGASKGLGLVCAKALASEGAILVLTARSKPELLKKSLPNSKNHLIVASDLTNPGAVSDLLNKSKNFFGDFDIVLHVAGGGLGLRNPLLSAEDFEKLYKLNIGIAAEINHYVIPTMVKRRKGNVVHIGSLASVEAGSSVGYSTAKAALAAYVRTLGRELANTGVIVTGILPGGFLAPRNSFERLKKNNPKAFKEYLSQLPRKKFGTAEEIVPLILWLCSPSATMMAGCCVPIDGGQGWSYLQ